MRFNEIKKLIKEDQDLFEINMSPTNLKKLAAQTGALAGMEFEMIVPGASRGDDSGELEPDFDSDERARSFSDIEEFFNDGDYNSRGEVRRLIEKLQEAYWEWESEKIDNDWANDGEDYLRDWINNNEWIQEDKVREHLEAMGLDEEGIDAAVEAYNKSPTYTKSSELKAAREADENYNNYIEADRAADEELEELVSTEWNDRGSMHDSAFDEYREENGGTADEGDFLEDARYRYMSDIANEFGITWPYWSGGASDGGDSIESVAGEFREAIGRKVNWSASYHGGKREPNTYVVEPDGSLIPDDSDDAGLEFVSPPLPIDDMISDLNKVKAWADQRGCYTSKAAKTGLHINVSVPGFDNDKLDYVKLALLLGDEYVLNQFGRLGNSYAASAMGIIKERIAQRPEDAAAMLQKMKTGLGELATKVVHSGSTSKFTSINTKTGYIEFRSPGGDWLDANFDKIETTLMRFVVALDAAMDPEKYRDEYLKKLYAVLKPKDQNDTLGYFAKFAAGELPKAALKSFIRQAQLERNKVKDTYAELKPGQSNYKIYQISDGRIVGTFYAADRTQADAEFTDWLMSPEAGGRDGFRYAPIDTPIQGPVASTPTPRPDIIDIEPDVAQNFVPGSTQDIQQRRAAGEFTGSWQIIDSRGNELHRFSGIGNSQADANRVAAGWLARAGYQDGLEVAVVPVMS